MFCNKLASFITSPSLGDVSLGHLEFTDIRLPFKMLDISELQTVDIREPFEFLLPLEYGERIVAFWRHRQRDHSSHATQISSFDRLGRLIGSDDL